MSPPDPLGTRPVRVPAYAWTWLQRSRPVVTEVGVQLYGGQTGVAVIERLRSEFPTDPFVQDVVGRVVCDVAFQGRVPTRRPNATNWDRGLVWWAARLAGMGVREFEERSRPSEPEQSTLFPSGRSDRAERSADPGQDPAPPRTRPRSAERLALADALRDLLAAGDGAQVPAAAVRALIAQLDG